MTDGLYGKHEIHWCVVTKVGADGIHVLVENFRPGCIPPKEIAFGDVPTSGPALLREGSVCRVCVLDPLADPLVVSRRYGEAVKCRVTRSAAGDCAVETRYGARGFLSFSNARELEERFSDRKSVV